MSKTVNFVTIMRDWKEPLRAKDVVRAVNKIVAATKRDAQVSDDICDRGDDSITTCIWPIDINRDRIREDVVDVFGWTDEIHIDSLGDLWFRFKDFGYGLKYGLSTDKWLNEDEAVIWMEGLMAAEEFVSGSVSKDERARFKELIEKAKALI